MSLNVQHEHPGAELFTWSLAFVDEDAAGGVRPRIVTVMVFSLCETHPRHIPTGTKPGMYNSIVLETIIPIG